MPKLRPDPDPWRTLVRDALRELDSSVQGVEDDVVRRAARGRISRLERRFAVLCGQIEMFDADDPLPAPPPRARPGKSPKQRARVEARVARMVSKATATARHGRGKDSAR